MELPAALVSAVVLAAMMGVACQYGGTCMVDAVRQLVVHKRIARLAAIFEAALLATVLMAIGRASGVGFPDAADHPVGAMVIAGGVLLGLGAAINGACLLGTIGRIGCRQFAWLATPLGFLTGVFGVPMAWRAVGGSMARSAPLVEVVMFAATLLALAMARTRGMRQRPIVREDRAFLLGTLAIGAIGTAIAAVFGAWSWTDSLSAIATERGVMGAGMILVAALLAGSLAAGFRRARAPWSARRTAACFVGGGLMGAGAALVPGGNDALVLNGLPAFSPNAWTAVLVMIATILAVLAVEKRLLG